MPGIKIKDPTTKDISILGEIAEDIGFSTEDTNVEYTVVYAKTSGFDVQNTGVAFKITGFIINTL